MICYDQASVVLQSPQIIIWIAVTWFAPLFLYFITGIIARARSANGKATSKPMIAHANFWYAVIIWGLIQIAFFILLIFPVWMIPFC